MKTRLIISIFFFFFLFYKPTCLKRAGLGIAKKSAKVDICEYYLRQGWVQGLVWSLRRWGQSPHLLNGARDEG